MPSSPPETPAEEDRLQAPHYTRETPLEYLKTDLYETFKGLQYPYRAKQRYQQVGLPDDVVPSGDSDPLRADNSLSDHYEYFLTSAFESYFQETDIRITSGRYREYPDTTLHLDDSDFPATKIALDVKTTTRKETQTTNSVSRCALLRADTEYFMQPNTKSSHITLPYNEYDRHWIFLVIHRAKDDYDHTTSNDRISEDVTVVVDDKWRLADDFMGTGSGRRNYVKTPTKTATILNRDGPFTSRDDFESWCRDEVRDDPSTDY